MKHRAALGIGFTLVVLAHGALVGAQSAPTPPVQQAAQTEVDPIKCWWRASTTAVIVGQRFAVTLTCAAVETDSVRVAPDYAQLDPSALQLTPFEVVGGRRHDDIAATPWNYFQYEYDVRLLGAEYFGRDLDVPGINISYHIISTANETEGRDRRYRLPPLPLRIVSQVPQKAADIRETTSDSLGAITALRFRSRSELLGAGVAFGFAGLLLAVAAMRAFSAFRSRRPDRERVVSRWRVLAGTLGAIRRVKTDVAGDGWNEERAARATVALRLGAAVASGQSVAQAAAGPEAQAQDGQLAMTAGFFWRRRMLVSAATEPRARNGASANGSGNRRSRAADRARDELLDALRIFRAARYGRNERLDGSALELALERGEAAIRSLRFTRLGAAVAPQGQIAKQSRGAP